MAINVPQVQIEEISSVLTPAAGVTLDEAIADAKLAGYQVLSVDRDNNQAVIVWFKRS